jgi:uncharacterized RDD family membrane protein YckC
MAFCAKCGKELPPSATFCPSCGAPVQAGAAATAPVSGIDTLTKDQKAQEYWVERLIAFVIDATIVFVILAVIAVIVALPLFLTAAAGLLTFLFGGFALLGGLVFVLYFTVFESSSGASLGKRIFRLKVVSKSGSNPTFGEAFIRNLSKIYWLLLLLDVIVGLAISKGYQQKYSDHLMGTSVTKA